MAKLVSYNTILSNITLHLLATTSNLKYQVISSHPDYNICQNKIFQTLLVLESKLDIYYLMLPSISYTNKDYPIKFEILKKAESTRCKLQKILIQKELFAQLLQIIGNHEA